MQNNFKITFCHKNLTFYGKACIMYTILLCVRRFCRFGGKKQTFMTYKEIINTIGKKVNKSELAEVYRERIDEYSTLMNPIRISDKLFCGQYTNDFYVDGFKVFKNSDITAIDTCSINESLKFNNMIYNKKGLLGICNIDFDIKDFKSLFDYLKNNEITATVECSFEDAIDYYVGRITGIDKNIAVMQCFDGCGIKFKDAVRVNIDYVTGVSFGDRYTVYMSEFVIW